MVDIVLRSGKSGGLLNTEIDANFNNLNTGKAEKTGDTFSGPVTFEQGFIATGYGRRNRVHNGRMQIMQRALYFGASIVNVASGGGVAYIIDRHRSYWPYSAWNGQQYQRARSDGVVCPWYFFTTSGAKASYAVTENSSPFSHVLEANDVYDLQGQPITVSFEFYANLAGTYSTVLRTYDSGGTLLASCVKTFTVASAATPQRVVLTFPAVPNGKLTTAPGNFSAMEIVIGALSGTNFACPVGQKDAWQNTNYISSADATNWHVTANNQVGITNLKLEDGPNASPGGNKTYQGDLEDCQRFAETGQMPQFYAPSLSAGGAMYWTVPFKQTKRAVPTVSLNNPSIWVNGNPTVQWPGTVSATTGDFRMTWNVANINGLTGEGFWLSSTDL